MKKIFGFIFALCLFVAIPANAQIKFGIKAGTNLVGSPSDIKGVSSDGYTGFFAGAMAKFTLPIVGLGIEGDVLYSQSGAELGKDKIKRQSIEIPIYLRYDLGLPAVSKIIVPFVAVGPQFGFTLNDADKSWMDAYRFEYKKSELSLNIGAGAILFSHLQAHINYNIAMGNTSEYSEFVDGAWNVMTKSKTNTWQISVAYLF